MAFSSSIPQLSTMFATAAMIILCVPAIIAETTDLPIDVIPKVPEMCTIECGSNAVGVNVNAFNGPASFEVTNGNFVNETDLSFNQTKVTVEWGKDLQQNTTTRTLNITSPDNLTIYEVTVIVRALPLKPPRTIKDVRIDAYISWINWILNEQSEELHTITTINELKNGTVLTKFVNIIFKNETKEVINMSYVSEVYENIIKTIKSHNISVEFKLEELANGDEAAIVQLLNDIRDYQIDEEKKSLNNVLAPEDETNRDNSIFAWVQKTVTDTETEISVDIQFTDFGSSMADGKVFSAILSRWTTHIENSFSYDRVEEMTIEERLNYVFDYAQQTLKVEPLVKVGDFINNQIDEKAVELYVSYLYENLPHTPRDLEEIGFEIVDEKFEIYMTNVTIQIEEYENWYKTKIEEVSKLENITANQVQGAFEEFDRIMADLERHNFNLQSTIKNYTNYYDEQNMKMKPALQEKLTSWSENFEKFESFIKQLSSSFAPHVLEVVNESIHEMFESAMNMTSEIKIIQELSLNITKNEEQLVQHVTELNSSIVKCLNVTFAEKFVEKHGSDYSEAEINNLVNNIQIIRNTEREYLSIASAVNASITVWNTQKKVKEDDLKSYLKTITIYVNGLDYNPTNLTELKLITENLKNHKINLTKIRESEQEAMYNGSSGISMTYYQLLMTDINKFVVSLDEYLALFVFYTDQVVKVTETLTSLDVLLKEPTKVLNNFEIDREYVNIKAVYDSFEHICQVRNKTIHPDLQKLWLSVEEKMTILKSMRQTLWYHTHQSYAVAKGTWDVYVFVVRRGTPEITMAKYNKFLSQPCVMKSAHFCMATFSFDIRNKDNFGTYNMTINAWEPYSQLINVTLPESVQPLFDTQFPSDWQSSSSSATSSSASSAASSSSSSGSSSASSSSASSSSSSSSSSSTLPLIGDANNAVAVGTPEFMKAVSSGGATIESNGKIMSSSFGKYGRVVIDGQALAKGNLVVNVYNVSTPFVKLLLDQVEIHNVVCKPVSEGLCVIGYNSTMVELSGSHTYTITIRKDLTQQTINCHFQYFEKIENSLSVKVKNNSSPQSNIVSPGLLTHPLVNKPSGYLTTSSFFKNLTSSAQSQAGHQVSTNANSITTSSHASSSSHSSSSSKVVHTTNLFPFNA